VVQEVLQAFAVHRSRAGVGELCELEAFDRVVRLGNAGADALRQELVLEAGNEREL
jgi:hypothetical protein